MQKEINLSGFVATDGEVEIGQWFKKEGEEFSSDDQILEVLSDKASFEVVFGISGKLISILHSDGEIVKISDPVAIIESLE